MSSVLAASDATPPVTSARERKRKGAETIHQIGPALRAARKAKGMTLRDLELLSGLPVSHISAIETGIRRDPAFGTVLRLARALGLTLDELLGAAQTLPDGTRSGDFVYDELRRLRKESAQCIERIDEFLAALELANR